MVDPGDADELAEELATQAGTRQSVAKPAGLDHDSITLNRIISALCLSIVFSENQFPPIESFPEGMPFRITLWLLLPMLPQFLIAQVPVLPQLQGRQQHHESAKS